MVYDIPFKRFDVLCDNITYSREAGGVARRWGGRMWGTKVVEMLLLGLLRMPKRSSGRN